MIARSTWDLPHLQADAQAGLRELDAGKPFDEEAVKRIKQAGRAKLRLVKGAGG